MCVHILTILPCHATLVASTLSLALVVVVATDVQVVVDGAGLRDNYLQNMGYVAIMVVTIRLLGYLRIIMATRPASHRASSTEEAATESAALLSTSRHERDCALPVRVQESVESMAYGIGYGTSDSVESIYHKAVPRPL